MLLEMARLSNSGKTSLINSVISNELESTQRAPKGFSAPNEPKVGYLIRRNPPMVISTVRGRQVLPPASPSLSLSLPPSRPHSLSSSLSIQFWLLTKYLKSAVW